MSVNHPIFKAGQTKDLRIEFTLVNDGDKVIDPKIPESQIVINGKELSDSGLILSSVQKGARFRALPPGESLQFGLPARGPVQGARNLSDFLEGRWFPLTRNRAPSLARRSPLILLDEVNGVLEEHRRGIDLHRVMSPPPSLHRYASESIRHTVLTNSGTTPRIALLSAHLSTSGHFAHLRGDSGKMVMPHPDQGPPVQRNQQVCIATHSDNLILTGYAAILGAGAASSLLDTASLI